MLLPKMTPAEMRKILLLDIDEVKERTHKASSKIYREIIKKKLKKQRKVFYRSFTSKNKTKWIVRIIKMKGYKYKLTAHLGCYFHDIKGFRYIEVDNDTERLDIYNSHFLKRYNERMDLSLDDNLELMKLFLDENTGSSFIIDKEELNPNISKVASKVPEGIKLGIQDLKSNCLIWNTFISQNEYKGNQEELSQNTIRRVKLKKALHFYEKEEEYYFLEKIIGEQTS